METIERIEQVPTNTRVSLRVIHYIQEHPDVTPQMQVILDAVKQGSPIFRHQLVVAVAPYITSTCTISQVVSCVLKKLKHLNCVRVQSFDEFKKELEDGQQK